MIFTYFFVSLLIPTLAHKLDEHLVSANCFLWISNTNILWNLNTSNIATRIFEEVKVSHDRTYVVASNAAMTIKFLISILLYTWSNMIIHTYYLISQAILEDRYTIKLNSIWEISCSLFNPKYYQTHDESHPHFLIPPRPSLSLAGTPKRWQEHRRLAGVELMSRIWRYISPAERMG